MGVFFPRVVLISFSLGSRKDKLSWLRVDYTRTAEVMILFNRCLNRMSMCSGGGDNFELAHRGRVHGSVDDDWQAHKIRWGKNGKRKVVFLKNQMQFSVGHMMIIWWANQERHVMFATKIKKNDALSCYAKLWCQHLVVLWITSSEGACGKKKKLSQSTQPLCREASVFQTWF